MMISLGGLANELAALYADERDEALRIVTEYAHQLNLVDGGGLVAPDVEVSEDAAAIIRHSYNIGDATVKLDGVRMCRKTGQPHPIGSACGCEVDQ